jgi:uncharacterized protein DUF4112
VRNERRIKRSDGSALNSIDPPRSLPEHQARRLRALRTFSRLLDSAITIPGTTVRIGLDPVLGLVPGLGDLVSPLCAIVMLIVARDAALPLIVQLRMVFNVAIDAFLGFVPIIGDLFDFAWRANDRNMELLDRYAYRARRASPGDWLFVGVLIAVLLLIAAVPVLLAGWLFDLLRTHL